VLSLLPIALASLLSQQPETMSLLKEPLYPPPVPKAERARLEDEAAQARADLLKNPGDADAIVRLALAQRGLGHVGDALETLTRALEGKADTPAIHLERGRGFVVIRKFDVAQKELRKAAETLPEAHCDIGFTLYVLADYAPAHDEYARCGQPGIFGYFAARRAGADPGPRPPLPDDPAQAAQIKLPGSLTSKTPKGSGSIYAAYIDAVDRLQQNDKVGARALLKPVLEKQEDRWMEPIYIAAEAEYARIAPPKRKKK
jgi:tetratricopeptide (TPR) repeat protein